MEIDTGAAIQIQQF